MHDLGFIKFVHIARGLVYLLFRVENTYCGAFDLSYFCSPVSVTKIELILNQKEGVLYVFLLLFCLLLLFV